MIKQFEYDKILIAFIGMICCSNFIKILRIAMRIEMPNTRKKVTEKVEKYSTKEIKEELAKATKKLDERIKEIERKEIMRNAFPRKR